MYIEVEISDFGIGAWFIFDDNLLDFAHPHIVFGVAEYLR